MAPRALSTRQVIFRIIAIISFAEFFIMLVLGVVPYKLGVYEEAVFDITLLGLLTIPPIYFWVVRPFVDARDEALRHVSHLAHTDPLTKLPNRRLLSNYFDKFMASSARHQGNGALLLIDLDGFKEINDQYGHDAGDQVLIEVARRIQSIIRTEDVVARLGGDEFVILLHQLDVDDQKARGIALQVAEKLVNLICQPIQFNGATFNVGASVGVRLFSSEVLDVETAIKDADIAMYQAKQNGRARAVLFEKAGEY
jgi:two-component system cell cycle response regulator